jgi:hypothetical protein
VLDLSSESSYLNKVGIREICKVEHVIFVLAGVLGGLISGWFIRHKLLVRKLNQTLKQMEELRALQLNLEHEASVARQKLLEHSEANLVDVKKQGKNHSETNETQKKCSEALKVCEKLKRENNDLLDQIAYFENEKSSWNDYREKKLKEIELLDEQNKDLEKKIAELSRKGGNPDDRDFEYWQQIKHAPKNDLANEDRQGFLSDNSDTTSLKDKDRSDQVHETDRVDTKLPHESDKIEPVKVMEENLSARSNLKNKQKDSNEPTIRNRKKKPKTVRVNRTTSEIIDNFKKDLGIPD